MPTSWAASSWLLLHIEVQGQSQAEFAERMYVYHYRIFDRFRRPVVSLAVLADSHATWRPDHFGYGRWGCELSLRFPMVKLIDYQERWAELDRSSNPFAVVVQAQRQAQLQGTASRYQAKLAPIKSLYRRGLARADILELFRCIDWMLRLPEDLDELIWCEIQTYEEATKMPYVTSVERIGIRKGIQKGLEQGLEQGRAAERQLLLRLTRKRFGDTSAEAIAPLLAQIQDTAVLEDLADLLLDCDNGVQWLAAVQGKVLGA